MPQCIPTHLNNKEKKKQSKATGPSYCGLKPLNPCTKINFSYLKKRKEMALRFHLIPIKMAIIKKTKKKKYWQRYREKGALIYSLLVRV
jgi:hypothetical protein